MINHDLVEQARREEIERRKNRAQEAKHAKDLADATKRNQLHDWPISFRSAANQGLTQQCRALVEQLDQMLQELTPPELWHQLEQLDPAGVPHSLGVRRGVPLPNLIAAVRGAKVNALASRTRLGGSTALHAAAWQGHAETVLVLASELGAQIDKIDIKARTPLHDAARNGQALAVRVLLRELGADQSLVDAAGQTPEQAAERLGHLQVVREFESLRREIRSGNLMQARKEASFGYNPHELVPMEELELQIHSQFGSQFKLSPPSSNSAPDKHSLR